MKVYCVIESNYSLSDASCYNGGVPQLFMTEKEAIEAVRKIVDAWNEMGYRLHPGLNDGDKWADERYDEDGTYAVIDTGCFHKAEIFCLEVPDPKEELITIVDRFHQSWSKTFHSKEQAKEWIVDGLTGTEGAERDHYVNMLLELDSGSKILHYN